MAGPPLGEEANRVSFRPANSGLISLKYNRYNAKYNCKSIILYFHCTTKPTLTQELVFNEFFVKHYTTPLMKLSLGVTAVFPGTGEPTHENSSFY